MRRFVILVVLMIIACLMTAGLARPQSAGQGKWSEKARLPEPRGEVAVALLNGKIYALGGSARGRTYAARSQSCRRRRNEWKDLCGRWFHAKRSYGRARCCLRIRSGKRHMANANAHEEPAGLGWSGCTQRKDLRDWRTWRRYGDGLNTRGL